MSLIRTVSLWQANQIRPMISSTTEVEILFIRNERVFFLTILSLSGTDESRGMSDVLSVELWWDSILKILFSKNVQN